MPRKGAVHSELPIPLYEQVKQYIVDGIRSGEWAIRRRVPSEAELVSQLGVSRMTVHRALRELSASGVIVRVQGVGTFAGDTKPISTLVETGDIAEEIRNRGNIHNANVKMLETVVLDRSTALAVGLRQGQEVFHSLIVHSENGVPVQVEERWINPSIAPGYLEADFTRTTPYQFLTRAARITEVEHIIHSVRADERSRKLLKITADEPCLLLLRRTWSRNILATSSRFLFPGKRYTLGSRYKIDGLAAKPTRVIPLNGKRADLKQRRGCRMAR